MTPEEIEGKIREIEERAEVGDDETAHSEQDELYRAVLRAIAEGADNAKTLATLALRVEDVRFARWYA